MLVSSRSEKEKAVNVQVLLRCRPFSEDELRNNAPQVVTCNEFQKEVSVSQAIAGKQFDRVFTFDKVFGPSAKQKDLYEQAIIPIVNEVLEGFNCTIFAYGQTGTGKTYTMEGECRRTKKASKAKLPLDAGVIPRAVKQIFDALESQHTDYSVKVTFLELYNEEITDLLAPEELSKISLEEKQKKQLPLMEDGKGGVLVRGLEEEIVTSADEIFSLLERGSSKRRTAETLLNKQSSRSHSLFSITIHIKEATPEGEELIKSGKLNLVDLAGSENISRSGAREGRAREAGEINKSLLTLGRVITALVEHLGHIPYRDSKLTRLLRDSLGGRTKTCIIATVSPSVHCLEETLSTLDYAHRAKNIKNRPEVNQKMMKSTLIKDLYGEIDRLKAEVYATREKVGVYIPKERYYQEEAERKAMTEQIEQMGVLLEANQKQIQELQEKYNLQLQQTTVMSKKLIATEKSLDHTNKQFATAKEDLQYSHYQLKEKDFIIAEQRKAENALAHQAFALKQDNASLFSKIAREDQLSAANKSLVDKFRADLSERIDTVCSLLASSIKRQNMHLQTVEQLSKSCLEFHDKALIDLKEKVSASRLTYAAHIEGMQNAITLHKATNNSSLEELSSAATANSFSLDHLLALGGADASLIFTELQHSLSNFRGEIAQFTGELRKRFSASLDHSKEISGFVFLLVEELREKSSLLQNHSNSAHEAMIRSITEFQRAYEEQTRSDTDKLVAFISSYMLRQKEMVDARLDGLKDAALESKAFLDRHASSAASTSGGAKRRWEEFYLQMRHDSTDGSDFSSAKHCRLEAILQQCVDSADATCQQWEKVRASASEMCAHQAKEMDAIICDAMESNERHGAEALAMRVAAEEDVAKNGAELIRQLDEVMDRERRSAGKAMAATESHRECLQELGEDHSSLASGINSCAAAALQQDYMVYEASGETPLKGEEVDVPDRAAIESLRAMPVDAMLEEFRENNPYEPAAAGKPSLIPRSPLNQLN